MDASLEKKIVAWYSTVVKSVACKAYNHPMIAFFEAVCVPRSNELSIIDGAFLICYFLQQSVF